MLWQVVTDSEDTGGDDDWLPIPPAAASHVPHSSPAAPSAAQADSSTAQPPAAWLQASGMSEPARPAC